MQRLTGATSPEYEEIERWTDECVDEIGLFRHSNRLKLSLVHHFLYSQHASWEEAYRFHEKSVLNFSTPETQADFSA
jgi:hypothetical protein